MKPFVNILFVILFIAVSTGCQTKRSNQSSDDQKLNDVAYNPHFDFLIGAYKNGEVEFVADPVRIKSHWSSFINSNSELEIQLTDIKIFEDDHGIFLLGRDTINQATAIIQLVLVEEELFEHKTTFEDDKETGYGNTIICAGCGNFGKVQQGECEPQFETGKGWYCSECSKGNCTKTTITTDTGGIAG